METKEELMNGVKDWVQTDNEISKLKAQIKLLNDQKKTLTTQLLDVMKTNEIDCFDIKGGSINYKKAVKNQLRENSFWFIIEILRERPRCSPRVGEIHIGRPRNTSERNYKEKNR